MFCNAASLRSGFCCCALFPGTKKSTGSMQLDDHDARVELDNDASQDGGQKKTDSSSLPTARARCTLSGSRADHKV